MGMPIERQMQIKKGLIELERHKQELIDDIRRHGSFREDEKGNYTHEIRYQVNALRDDIRDQQALIEELQEWGEEYAYIATEALKEALKV